MRVLLPLIASIALLAGAPALAYQGGDDADSRRGDILRLIEQAERGPLSAFDVGLRAIGDHPLRPWLEYARLRRALGPDSGEAVADYLSRHGDIAPGRLLRDQWLRELAGRGEWAQFQRFHVDSNDSLLRCAHLRARASLDGVDEAWYRDAAALWLSPRSLPDLCDPAFERLQDAGRITPDLRWQRFMLAADAGELGLARFLARGLPDAESARAEDYVAFLETPHDRARGWVVDDRSQRIASLGLVRLARNDPDEAERRLEALAGPLRLTEPHYGPVRASIALWTVASYGDRAAQRLAAVPASAYDDRLHEWRVRNALARQDDDAALAAIRAMPREQRESPRWTYFQARLLERNGGAEQARTLYAQAARTATFHGFLAADRIDAPYALCPLEVPRDTRLRRDVAANPALVRAIELFRLGRPGWAEREWRDAIAGLDERERLEAIRLARAVGWHDRIFSLGNSPEELRHYRLRFPLAYPTTVRNESARHELDPALVAALTRAESAWMPRARSPADARGLMQVLPTTGAGVARRHGIEWTGPDALYRPVTNIRLGTAYKREMLDRHGGRPYLALAAYNAGPAPVSRWYGQRGDFDPDLWIETITFRETREYVARVLAFSVIYDWRLGQDAVPVSDRMLGRSVAASQRRPFVCPSDQESSTP